MFILYRDIRTYGERELLYRKARQAGVLFIRFSVDRKPLVSAGKDGLGNHGDWTMCCSDRSP